MKLLLLIPLMLLTSCGALVPSTSRRSTATTEASASALKSSEQFSRIVSGQPKAPVAELHVGGLGNKVELKIPQVEHLKQQTQVQPVTVPVVAQEAIPKEQPYREETRYSSNVDATDTDKSATKENKDVSIPIGVNIALLGIGVLIALFAFNRVRKSSMAVNAAYETFDGILAGQIRSVRERAILATDNPTISLLNAQIADLESQRGRLTR
jgi:hypothetical protein